MSARLSSRSVAFAARVRSATFAPPEVEAGVEEEAVAG